MSILKIALTICAISAIAFAGRSSRRSHHGLPFFQNVTEEGRREYFRIINNQNLTIAQIENQTESWASTYGVAEQYNAIQANVTANLEQVRQNVTSVINNLPTVGTQLETILDNENQTIRQQFQAVEALSEQYPIEVNVLLLLAEEVELQLIVQNYQKRQRNGNSE